MFFYTCCPALKAPFSNASLVKVVVYKTDFKALKTKSDNSCGGFCVNTLDSAKKNLFKAHPHSPDEADYPFFYICRAVKQHYQYFYF